jgi:hypothetical protein
MPEMRTALRASVGRRCGHIWCRSSGAIGGRIDLSRLWREKSAPRRRFSSKKNLRKFPPSPASARGAVTSTWTTRSPPIDDLK